MSEDTICDICGGSCVHFFLNDDKENKENGSVECATLEATWGYFSRKDLYREKCLMCEECYDKITAFILLLGGKVRRTEYDPWTGMDREGRPFHSDFFYHTFICGREGNNTPNPQETDKK